jgi:hypothetical protein
VRDVLSGDGYISGLTQYLIVLSQKFDGAQKALECWHEAFKVIESRLPTSASVPCLFEGAIEIRSDWCIDELFIGLLLTIDDASFDAVHFIFQSLPAQSIRPLLRFYPSLSAPLKLKTLRTLERTIPFPREVAESIRNDLEQTAGSGWTLAELSQRILSLLDH